MHKFTIGLNCLCLETQPHTIENKREKDRPRSSLFPVIDSFVCLFTTLKKATIHKRKLKHKNVVFVVVTCAASSQGRIRMITEVDRTAERLDYLKLSILNKENGSLNKNDKKQDINHLVKNKSNLTKKTEKKANKPIEQFTMHFRQFNWVIIDPETIKKQDQATNKRKRSESITNIPQTESTCHLYNNYSKKRRHSIDYILNSPIKKPISLPLAGPKPKLDRRFSMPDIWKSFQ